MAKALKVAYKGIKAKYENDKLVGVLEIINEETGEVVSSNVNITEEVKTLLSTLEEDGKIELTIKEFKEKTPKERKPTYKYHCGCEGNEIKSSCEELHIHCTDCDEDFVRAE